MARRPRKGKSGYSGFDLAIGPSYKIGWSRAEQPLAVPTHECSNCHAVGSCFKWKLQRQVFAFGKLITQHMEVIECRHCLNEFVLGSLDFGPPKVKEGTRKGASRFNLRKWTPEQRAKLMELIEREIKEGRIK